MNANQVKRLKAIEATEEATGEESIKYRVQMVEDLEDPRIIHVSVVPVASEKPLQGKRKGGK